MNIKFEKGFTLVELLASIIVIVAIGSVLIGVFVSSLRGSNKTALIEGIRQSGDYAINQMSKNISYAQVFDGFSMDGGANDAYHANCHDSYADTPIPNFPYPFIKVHLLNGDSVVYNCSSFPPILTVSTTSGGTTVPAFSPIDANSYSLTACSLTCTQVNSTDAPTVGISFTLEPKVQNSLVENSSAPIKFETSVAIRNYRKE